MSHILTLNAGSSSLKFALFQVGDTPLEIATGLIEEIGADARLKIQVNDAAYNSPLSGDGAKDHQGALRAALQQVARHIPDANVTAVGHRVVHGGMDFSDPVVVTPEILHQLETLIPFAPLHQPHNLSGIEAAIAAFPDARQIACFDTAFHRGQPFEADAFALPRRYYDQGVRRYGFHGLSYAYIADTLARTCPDLFAGRVAVAHLGNGASICGMVNGRSVASTMGFTALDGLPMGTRCGQLDPGVILYMLEQEGLTPAQISQTLYSQSGLLGLSGLSSDMRQLLSSPTPEAAQAVNCFTARIRHELGALAAEMEGLDAIVFCGGIGENAAPIRKMVCEKLRWIGVDLDQTANETGQTVITSDKSRVQVLVIPTNEELVIARAALASTFQRSD